jgi:RNA exonuclease 4
MAILPNANTPNNKRSPPNSPPGHRRPQMNKMGSPANNRHSPVYHRRPCCNEESDNDSSSSSNDDSSSSSSGSTFLHAYKKPVMPARSAYVAMDCEMVAVSSKDDGQATSVCARIVLLDWKGRVALDTYVQPEQTVTDYRTHVSGITADHLVHAPSIATVRSIVLDFLQDKILVGHGLENDLSALQISHPLWLIRDTAYYQPFMQTRFVHYDGSTALAPRKLRELCTEKLHRDIQVPGVPHCPAEDARAALDLYKSHRPRWEACMVKQQQLQQRQQHYVVLASYQQQQQQQLQQQQPIPMPPFVPY